MFLYTIYAAFSENHTDDLEGRLEASQAAIVPFNGGSESCLTSQRVPHPVVYRLYSIIFVMVVVVVI